MPADQRATLLSHFLLVCVVFLGAGCRINVLNVSHDETRAVADANKVLSLLYLKGDYVSAYEGLAPETRKSLSSDALKALLETLRSRHGRLLSLRADSFAIMPGQKALTLFYVGTHEKGTSYHRVVVTGDASGYRVAGLWFSDQPYPEGNLRTKFRTRIEVK